MQQYRLTVNGTVGIVLNAYPGEQWSRIAGTLDARGGTAKFERRYVFTEDADTHALFPDYLRVRGLVIAPWQSIAELDL